MKPKDRIRVTLDTNIFGPVSDISAYPTCPDPAACSGLKQRILDGVVAGYVSEGSLSLEALERNERIEKFFREWATKSTGIVLPTPHPKRIQIVTDALTLGIKVLRVPNIALGSFVDIPQDSWANDDIFTQEKRQKRHSDFVDSYRVKGPVPLKKLGAALVLKHGLDTSRVIQIPGWPPPEELIWLEGIVAEFDNPKQFGDRNAFVNHVRDLIAEWCDRDILASHYAYGNDYFCTFDEARNTGFTGILHPTNRTQLKEQWRIKVIDPQSLLTLI